MDSFTSQASGRSATEPVRRARVGPWLVELLPRQAYEATYVPDCSVIGFAFDAQAGVHAFCSDRLQPFRTRPNSLAYVPHGCDVFSSSSHGGEYLRVIDMQCLQRQGRPQQPFNDAIDLPAIAAAQSLRSLLLAGAVAPLLIEERAIVLAERVDLALKDSRPSVAHDQCMTSARLRRLDDLIDAEISGALTISHMAASLSLSDGFFIRAFTAAVGKSPHSYLIDRRLARARTLLRTSHHDLREIALATGFSSHAHMTVTFRTRLGVSPGQLRRQFDKGNKKGA